MYMFLFVKFRLLLEVGGVEECIVKLFENGTLRPLKSELVIVEWWYVGGF